MYMKCLKIFSSTSIRHLRFCGLKEIFKEKVLKREIQCGRIIYIDNSFVKTMTPLMCFGCPKEGSRDCG